MSIDERTVVCCSVFALHSYTRLIHFAVGKYQITFFSLAGVYLFYFLCDSTIHGGSSTEYTVINHNN